MKLKTIREETVGGRVLRLLEAENGYVGIVLGGKQRLGPFEDADPARLWARLMAEQGKADPNYFGYRGAVQRLLHIFRDGLQGDAYMRWERAYKVEAKARLDADLPLERARRATAGDAEAALRAYRKTNLLSPFEKTRVTEMLRGPHGGDFIRAAAEFADGNLAGGLSDMERMLRAHGQPSWPVVTYLPFLWAPESHMILKPEVTIDFARRVGHRFATDYDSGLKADVYRSLLDLVAETDREIAELRPRDRIDTQSFIWIIGKYTDADVAEVHRQAGSAARLRSEPSSR